MVEYQNELEKRLGIPVEMVMSDWGVLIADLQANKIDLVTAALFATPERKEVALRRYRLVVADACPWANRARITHRLLLAM